MSFEDISHLQLWQLFCSAERDHLSNFGRGHNEEHIRGIVLNWDRWFRRRCRLKIFLIYSSGAILFGGGGHLYNFDEG